MTEREYKKIGNMLDKTIKLARECSVIMRKDDFVLFKDKLNSAQKILERNCYTWEVK